MMKRSIAAKVAVAGALALGLLAVPQLSTASAAPAQPCSSYTAMFGEVTPSTVTAGDAITLTGLAEPFQTVTATLETPTPTALGSDVAGFLGDYTINSSVPGSVPAGIYDITFVTAGCIQFEVSIAVAAPLSASVLAATDEVEELEEAPATTEAPPTTDAPTTTAAPTTTEAPPTTAAPTTTTAPASSSFASCGVSEAGRTFIPGQEVLWTLDDSVFDTSKNVRLRLRNASSASTVYALGPWPASSQTTMTIPADAAPGAYMVEQAGYLLSNGKITTKNCTVYVVDAPSPASSGGPLSGTSNVPAVGFAIAAMTVAALIQLRLQRVRRSA